MPEIFETSADVNATRKYNSEGEPIIELDAVQYSYSKNSSIVLNIKEWHVSQGSHVFLHGRSGSGKTTLLNILAGLLVPQSGRIKVFNTVLNEMKASRRDSFRAEHIGIIFQQFNLIPWLTVKENIMAARHFAKSLPLDKNLNNQIEELLTMLRLDASIVHDKTGELSIGQQQRVAIARALINKPEIIIADEPTSSLDADACDHFISLLFNVADSCNATLIFVSHDQSLAQYFHQVVDITQINAS